MFEVFFNGLSSWATCFHYGSQGFVIETLALYLPMTLQDAAVGALEANGRLMAKHFPGEPSNFQMQTLTEFKEAMETALAHFFSRTGTCV